MADKTTTKDNSNDLEQTFVFPELGVSVQATDYDKALNKVEAQEEKK